MHSCTCVPCKSVGGASVAVIVFVVGARACGTQVGVHACKCYHKCKCKI